MPYVLAHDVGTSGNKAVLYDGGGVLRASASAPYATVTQAPGHAEQDPRDWWAAVASTSRAVLEHAGVVASDVAAVGFSGQMMGCVPVDAAGEALRPAIIWADTRATEHATRVAGDFGARQVYEITGHRASESYSAAKCAWLRDHEPAVYRRSRAFLQAKDYVIARSTGRFVTDPSDASGTNLYDLSAGRWSSALVDAWGLDENQLPEVLPSTAVAGPLRPGPASELGLAAGTPVVVGGGDGACAAVGAGAIRPGVAYASLGSSSWIGLCSDRPLLDPDMRTFTWAHLIDGAFAPTGTMQTAGLSQTWAEGLIADAGALDTLAEHAPPGAAGLVFLPYLLGERSPHWNPNARGAFVGLTLRHGPAHLARAVLEGVALNLRTILDCFDGVDGTVERVRLTGGGARSALSAQILADVLEVETVVPDAAESVSGLGAAVAAGVGVGLYDGWDAVDAWRRPERAFKPDPQRAARYRVLHGVFTDAYESLETTFGRLSALEKERSDGSD